MSLTLGRPAFRVEHLWELNNAKQCIHPEVSLVAYVHLMIARLSAFLVGLDMSMIVVFHRGQESLATHGIALAQSFGIAECHLRHRLSLGVAAV